MKLAASLTGIANAKHLKESTLDERGIEGVVKEAFIKIVAKVRRYIDLSLGSAESVAERLKAVVCQTSISFSAIFVFPNNPSAS